MKEGHKIQIWETLPENFSPRVEVAGCYLEVNGKILLMERASTSLEPETWGVPAGKVEKGETTIQGAIRELFEETGIQINGSQIEQIGTLYINKPNGDYLYHLFQVECDEEVPVRLSGEHTKYLWASPEDITNLRLIGGGHECLDFYQRCRRV